MAETVLIDGVAALIIETLLLLDYVGLYAQIFSNQSIYMTPLSLFSNIVSYNSFC